MMDKLISQQAAIEAVDFGITYAKAINKETGEVIELFKQSNEELRKAVERIKQLPSVQSERKGTRLSTVCLLCKKPAVTFNTEDDIPYTNYSYCEDCLRKGLKLLREQKKNLQAQPERKDALEKAVAIEAISDELMSRFDISATYAYEVAESAVNRIEVMAKKMDRGEDG